MKKIILTSTLLLGCCISVSAKADSGADLENEKKLSSEYVSQMAKEENAAIIDRGIVLRPIFKSASDIHAQADSVVHVSYFLTDREGKLIEESFSSDEDVAFPLKKLIVCWQIAIPQMTVGSLYKITCPSDTAYGDAGAGDAIKPGAALTFRITLFGL